MTTLDIAPTPMRSRAGWLAMPEAVAWLYGALVALAASPVLFWPIPRGNDLVDHWARLTLYHQASGDPIAGLYRIHFGLIPNLGVDLMYLALSPLLTPLAVIKLAWALSIILPALGAFAIHRAVFDKPSPTIWIVPFLSYNVATTVGLINFCLGAGLAMLAVAYALKRREGLRARDVLMLNAFGAALFFFHLIALAMYGVLLAGVLALPLRAPPRQLLRRAVLAALSVAVPAALVLLREHSPSAYNLEDTVGVGVMAAPIYTMTAWDRVFMYMLIGLASMGLLPGMKVAPRAWGALAAFALFAFLVPSWSGAATLIDARLKVYLWYFAFAVTSLKTEAMFDRMRPYIAGAAIAATALRVWALAPVWDEFNERAVEMRRLMQALPMGSRVLVTSHDDCDNFHAATLSNLTTFAVIDRRSFVSTLFAQSGMQPIAPTDAMLDGGPTIGMDSRWLSEEGRRAFLPSVLRAKWAQPYIDWRHHFTHIVDTHVDCASTLKGPGLTPMGAIPGFDLYKIE
jgi:hypothetical protein